MGFHPKPLAFHKTDNRGFPKLLKPWKHLISSNSSTLQRIAVNTVFGTVKALRLSPILDTTSISRRYTGKATAIAGLSRYIEEWKGIKELTFHPEHEFQLRRANGPSGPAVYTCLKDLSALKGDGILFAAVRALGNITFPYLENWFSKTLVPSRDLHSKVLAISDKAGKSRPIAIADYWSQRALKPLHDALILHLKSLKRDCTYAHDMARDVLIHRTGHKMFIGTSDITAFTDRFPIEPQMKTISRCFGDDISGLWIQVILLRGFKAAGREKLVYWNVGQPLGLYSS